MAVFCEEVQEWIEEKVEKPIEEWIKKREKKCKKKKCKKWCLCCNKWFCWIETFFEKVIKWIVVTIGKWVVRVVCEVVHTIIDLVGFLIGLVFAIPGLGRLLREIWDFIVEAVNRIIGVIDLIGCAFGINWEKRLRICVIILRDEKGNEVGSEDAIKIAIDNAKKIYKEEANVKLMVNGIFSVDKPSPSYSLDVHCNAGAWGDDLGLAGSYFEFNSNFYCFDGIANRLTGYAAPVVVFVVRDVIDKSGCSMGPVTDYVTVEGKNPVCLAHEIGHACSLWHHSNRGNLMHSACGGTNLKKWQKCILRNSRHVTYL